ncbi:TlpA family protein disulfide reductase [Lacunimicrobium album]
MTFSALTPRCHSILSMTVALTLGIVFISTSQAQSFSTLYWNQGDQLAGTLEAGDADTVTWKSPSFRDPLQVKVNVLSRVQFPHRSTAVTPIGQFRIEMHNKDILYGDLLNIEEEYLTFTSPRMGQFRLKRSEIHNLRRHNDAAMIYNGPRGMKDWVTIEAANRASMTINGQAVNVERPSPWKETTLGKIKTDSPGKIFQKVSLPELCEIELQLESSSFPSFRLGFDRRPSENLRLETWEDVVVLVSRYDFVEVTTLQPDQKLLHLHLFLDRKQSKVYAYSHDGQKLAELTFKQPLGQPHGIFLENLQRNLTLDLLSISGWDGTFPKPVKTGEQRFLLADGTVQYGAIKSFDAENGVLYLEYEGKTVDYSLKFINQIVISERIEEPSKVIQPQVSWYDGAFLTGKVNRTTADTIEVQTSHSPEPLVCRLDEADQLVLPPGEATTDQPDRVYFAGGSMAGTLAFDEATQFPIKWKPIGGLNASALASAGDARFLRGERDYSLPFDAEQFPDVLFLQNDDIVPVKVTSGNLEQVQFESPFCSSGSMPASEIRALEFTAAQIAATSGFSHPEWKMVDGKLDPATQTVSFMSTGSAGHPSILKGDEIRFRIDWGAQPATALVNFFSSEVTKKGDDGLQLHFTTTGSRITVETVQEVALRNRNQFGMRYQQETATAICPEMAADIRCVFQDGAAIVYVNGQPTKTVALARETRRGNAFTIQVQLARTPNRNIRSSNGVVTPAPAQKPVVLSQFRVESIRGSVIKQFILEESRRKTLLVPRFNRNDPPTHVLLAPNGDLLRGRLDQLTSDTISFESKLEPLRLEKSRVAGLIWLPKPVAAPLKPDDKTEEKSAEPAKIAQQSTSGSPLVSMPAAKDTVDQDAIPFGDSADHSTSRALTDELQLRLTHGYALSMKPTGMKGDHLLGTSSLLGECRIPVSLISGVYLGNSARQAGESAYSEWVPIRAPEPEWDIPEDSDDVPGKQLVGRVMDDFELATVDGQPFKLSAHTDKVIVLDFWATWCGPCVRALPGYIEATNAFDKDKVIFVAMNLRETPQQIREFLAGQQYPKNPMIGLDTSGEIADRFRVTGIPHTVILSPGMVLQNVHVGFSPDGSQVLRKEIEDILAGKLPSEEKKNEIEKPKP